METSSNWFVKHEVRFYKFNELCLREMTGGLEFKKVVEMAKIYSDFSVEKKSNCY